MKKQKKIKQTDFFKAASQLFINLKERLFEQAMYSIFWFLCMLVLIISHIAIEAKDPHIGNTEKKCKN